MKKLIIEFIGTFFLVLVIGLCINRPWPFYDTALLTPIAIGSILMAMVYMGGPVSGAHYNPAVTLGVFLRKKISGGEAAQYMAVQLLGAIAASGVYFFLLGQSMSPPAPVMEFHYHLKPLLMELLFTFALVSVVLNVATTKKAAGNSYFGLAIGFTVAAGAIAAGPYSGGAFNPAVAVGPMLVGALFGHSAISMAWFYILGQFAGAALAAWVFMITNPDEMQG